MSALLNRLVGVGRVAESAPADVVDHRAMTVNQGRKGALIATFDSPKGHVQLSSDP